MRAKEFTINVPITISINGDDEPVINAGQQDADSDEMDQNPVMVSPLQQQIELQKAQLGKESPVIDQLTQDTPDIGEKPSHDDQLLNRIRALSTPPR